MYGTGHIGDNISIYRVDNCSLDAQKTQRTPSKCHLHEGSTLSTLWLTRWSMDARPRADTISADCIGAIIVPLSVYSTSWSTVSLLIWNWFSLKWIQGEYLQIRCLAVSSKKYFFEDQNNSKERTLLNKEWFSNVYLQASLIKWNTKLAVGWFKFYNHYLHMKCINHLVMPCWSGVFNNFKAK